MMSILTSFIDFRVVLLQKSQAHKLHDSSHVLCSYEVNCGLMLTQCSVGTECHGGLLGKLLTVDWIL